ncbi:MAG: ATP-binding cassette domain-containing protein [Candidatus Rokuibacteriota bacterium]
MPSILETRSLTKRFGGLTAISNLNFGLEPGELRCLVGPNGAGKTTLFNLITGKEKPTAGEVYFMAGPISHLKVHEISRKGIGRKFQIPNVYESLTVYENVAVAFQHSMAPLSLLRGALRRDLDDRIMMVLSDIGLAGKREMPAAYLSHGEKQWLEIGMVLASAPHLLLFDEPTAGMTTEETKKTVRLIQDLSARRLTILLIGHDMQFIRAIARKITVLHKGQIVAEGDIAAIESNRLVRDIYLGKA